MSVLVFDIPQLISRLSRHVQNILLLSLELTKNILWSYSEIIKNGSQVYNLETGSVMVHYELVFIVYTCTPKTGFHSEHTVYRCRVGEGTSMYKSLIGINLMNNLFFKLIAVLNLCMFLHKK